MNSFPDFSLLGHDGKTYALSDFAGKKVVVYFYPKDDTPGCTIEAKDFRDVSGEFEKLNAVIVGVSPDDGKSHCKFIDKYDLNFLLLSDTEKSLVQELGIWKEKSMYGKKYMGVDRTTYVLDEQGSIQKVWENVQALGHAREVLAFVKGMES